MDLATVLGLAVSGLGMGKDIAESIQKKFAKKVKVTPHLIETTSRHWDATNSVIVQNKTDGPLFSVQVVFWHDANQKLQFKFEKLNKEAQVKDVIVDYGVVIFRGQVNEEKVVYLEFLRLIPGESVEIDLQIEKKGKVRVFPGTFNEEQSKQVLSGNDKFGYPFSPPFSMKLESIALNLRRKES